MAIYLGNSLINPLLNSIDVKIESRYRLIINEKQTETISGVSSFVFDIEDCSINTVIIDSASTPVYLRFPEKIEFDRARDFLIRLEITSAEVPQIGFILPNGESADFESSDESWMEFTPGVNFLSFTETKNQIPSTNV